jgi:hypothetical protein
MLTFRRLVDESNLIFLPRLVEGGSATALLSSFTTTPPSVELVSGQPARHIYQLEFTNYHSLTYECTEY